MPTPDALQMLLKGDQIRPAAAKKMGLVQEVAPADQIVTLAKAWVKANPSAKAPWDDPKFKLPSGKVFSPQGMMIWPPANAIYRRETYDNYPAAKAILTSRVRGPSIADGSCAGGREQAFRQHPPQQGSRGDDPLAVPVDGRAQQGRAPSGQRPADELAQDRRARRRPDGRGHRPCLCQRRARGGARSTATRNSADKGKAYSDKIISAQIAKGRAKTADKDALLARIKATADYAELKGCDLIIEAVFEDRAVKAEATTKAQAVVGPDVVFASNTSTLPISSLAGTSLNPDHFIGVHFFSPVEKMMLTEIIMGEKTGAKALATAMDYVRAIKKTPIVVNDCRGFYVNRCVGAYMVEAHAMVMEGVPAPMIENAAKMAGMPVGPLALNDEVGVDLSWKIIQAAKQDLGANAVDPAQEKLIEAMVVRHGRLGRKNGKGFYDYPANGPKSLWPGLAPIVGKRLDPDTIRVKDLKDRYPVRGGERGRAVPVRGHRHRSARGRRRFDPRLRLCALHRGGDLVHRWHGDQGLRRPGQGAGSEIWAPIRARR